MAKQDTRSGKKRERRGVPLTFAYALRSFTGYLEGTEKAAHTIRNYKSDLMAFEDFLKKGLGSRRVELGEIGLEDVEKYHEHLKGQGFKTNTRRRKILTVRRLLRYLSVRKKLGADFGDKIPAPGKLEKIPKTFPAEELIAAIRALPADTDHQKRSRALMWVLAETGCQVSEVCRLKPGDISADAGGFYLALPGRTVGISAELANLLRSFQTKSESDYLFLGFNKFGPLPGPISSRGVEILVKAYASKLGFDALTPRSFRHSAVMKWLSEGIAREEIQKRLGLKTPYLFRVYEPLLKSSLKTTSSA